MTGPAVTDQAPRDSGRVHPRPRRSLAVLLGRAAGAAMVLVAGCSTSGADDAAARQAMVESRGARVMRFDQRRTTHVFRSTATGGEQTVVAKDVSDTDQVSLIRRHLRDEAKRFAAGDLSDPMAIHGMEMPGLEDLRRAAGRVRVVYSSAPRGARITYTTRDAAALVALHDWFDAQLEDHGTNAHS